VGQSDASANWNARSKTTFASPVGLLDENSPTVKNILLTTQRFLLQASRGAELLNELIEFFQIRSGHPIIVIRRFDGYKFFGFIGILEYLLAGRKRNRLIDGSMTLQQSSREFGDVFRRVELVRWN
jgi:hypothetical protein